MMVQFLKQIYYRRRIKRRLKEIKTGKVRTNSFVEPVTIDDLVGNESDLGVVKNMLNDKYGKVKLFN